MAAIKTANPFDKGTTQYKLFNALKSGKPTPAEALVEAVGGTLSNRTIGVFIRTMEAKKFRFERVRSAEEGMTYTMYEGDAAKEHKKIGVTPGSYKERPVFKNAAKAAKKAAKATTTAPPKKAVSKPTTKAAQKPAKSRVKAAATGKSGKPLPRRGDAEEAAVEQAEVSTPKKAIKVGLKLKKK